MAVLDDKIAETPLARRDLAEDLARVPLFAALDPATLRAVAAGMDWFSLPGGATLFEAGESPDSLYVVLSGCLVASVIAPDGFRRLVGRIGAGETVGELALISGSVRNATVTALRDSEMGRLSREGFEALLMRHPEAMLRLAQLTAQRLDSAQRQQRGRRIRPKTITLVPHSLEVDVIGFGVQLTEALAQAGRTELVWNARGQEHTSQWFHRVESGNDFVIYVAEPQPSAWSRLCLRQADLMLLIAPADAEAAAFATLDAAADRSKACQRSELVLLHDGALHAGAARRWLGAEPALTQHHHVRDERDVARLARLVTGRGLGIVLSGGGARGFAHIGVLRALLESGLAVDAIGGTSMGAIMGAGAALGWSHEEMRERFRRTFVDTNPLNDYTLPFVSLVAGRKVTRLLRQEFGELDIEDLPLPYFCVSANLTSGRPAIHRRGALWRWLRASVAIPGVLPPVFQDGEVFVDGGAINNLPVDVMREIGRGAVIGVDVAADPVFRADFDDIDVPPLWRTLQWFRGKRRRVNILQILWRAGMVNSAAATAVHREHTDLLLQPPLEQIDMLDWRAFERAIDSGYRHTLERIERLPGPLVAASGCTVLAGPDDPPQERGLDLLSDTPA
ncbi:MAG: patatin-like phospholipase family protein [Gammaproteobacteria bacterium]|nr:patatin-like phospholipase family protein [Gammaproteobacteria bacterium]